MESEEFSSPKNDGNNLNEIISYPDNDRVNEMEQTTVPALEIPDNNEKNQMPVIYENENRDVTNEVKDGLENCGSNWKVQISTSVSALSTQENNGNSRIPVFYINDNEGTNEAKRTLEIGGKNKKEQVHQHLSKGYVQVPNASNNEELQGQGQTVVVSSKRWVILCAAFFAVFMTTGFQIQMSIFYVEWLDEFNKSNSETSLVQSVNIGSFLIGGCINGLAITKFGPVKCGIVGGVLSMLGLTLSFIAKSILHLTLAIGVATGIGFSLSYLSANFTVGQYFDGKQRLLVLAFVSFGGGCGASVLPFISTALINQFGWRGALLVLAGVYTHLVAFPILYTKPRKMVQISQIDSADLRSICKNCNPQSKTSIKTISSSSGTKTPSRVSFTTTEIRQLHGEKEDSEEKSAVHILINLLRKKVFLLYILGLSTSMPAVNSFMIFFVNYLESKGLNREETVSILTYMNISSTSVRMIPALAKLIPHFSVLAVPAISTSMISVSFVLFTLTGASFTGNLAVAVGFGAGVGGIVSVFSSSIVKLVGSKSYAVGLGIAMTIVGIMNTLAGPIGGLIRDETGDYELQFYLSAGALLLSCLLFVVAMVMRHIENKDLPSRFDFELVIKRKSRRTSSLFQSRKKSMDITSL